MSHNTRKPKKVGFFYKTGQWFKDFTSGVDREPLSEEQNLESFAKNKILSHMYMTDLRKLREEFNLADPEEKVDPETKEKTFVRKDIGEQRDYVRQNVNLIDLENYIALEQKFRSLYESMSIKFSEVVRYAKQLAEIRQAIHWTLFNIIDRLTSEDKSEFDVSYLSYWTKKLADNIYEFTSAGKVIISRKDRLEKIGFDPVIFESISKCVRHGNNLYNQLYNLVSNGIYNNSDLEAYRISLGEIDAALYLNLKKIRWYIYGSGAYNEPRRRSNLVTSLRKQVNELTLYKFNFKLLNQDEDLVEQVGKECKSREDLIANIVALGSLIDGINVREMENMVKGKHEKGSINVLEQFLKEYVPNYSENIISNLRKIMVVRSQWLVHQSTQKAIKLIQDTFGDYPVYDFNEFWGKILGLYLESLKSISNLMQSE